MGYKASRKEKENAHDTYEKNFKCVDGDAGSRRDIRTTKDKQFDLTLTLHEDAKRLEEAIDLLNSCIDTFFDKEASATSKKASRKLVKATIVPALSLMSTHMHDAAVRLAPLSSSGYVHKRKTTSKKRKVQTTMKESDEIDISLLKDYVNSEVQKNNHTTPTKMITRAKAAKKGHSTKTNALLPVTVTPPTPKNGQRYGRTEFCELVSQYKPRSSERKALYDAILASPYVSYHRRSLDKLLRQYKEFQNGETFTSEDMSGPGAPPIVTEEELQNHIEEFQNHSGQVMTAEKIGEFVESSKRQKLEGAGYCPLSQHSKVSNQTKSNYLAMAAATEGIHIATSVINKTDARFAAEASWRIVFTNVILILMTHFIEIPEEDPNIRRLGKELSDKDRFMYDLASKVRGNRAVRPLPAKSKNNRDDKVIWVRVGSKEEGDSSSVFLCSYTSLQNKGHASLFDVRDEHNIPGIRTKIHADLNGEGASAKQCLTFALNEREMPDDDMIVLELEDFCIGGSAANNTGYIIFLKKTPGAELKRFQFIEKHVHLPFIEEKCRSKDIPNCPVVSSCDGDMSQLKCVTSKEVIEVYNERNITAIKHNASNTGCEQSCDKGRVFPTIEEEYNKLTLADLPGVDDTMKKRLEDSIQECGVRLDLKGPRKQAIINTVCTYPSIATKAFTSKNAKQGFILNANLDTKYKLFPSFDGILGTCKRKIPKEVFDRFMNNVQYLYDIMEKLGHIPEDIWDEIGIPEDLRTNGEVFKRDAGIERECQQRAKILNHSHQIKLRDERREEIDAARREKERDARKKILEKIDGDKASVEKLLGCLKGRDPSAEQNLANCTVDDFNSLLVPPLRNFILNRSEDKKYSKMKDLKSISKGSIAQAREEAGREGSDNDHLVSIAFRLRTNKCKLDDIQLQEEESGTSRTNADNRTTLIHVAMDPTADWLSPADILSNHVWVDNIRLIFNSRETQSLLQINDEVKNRAASLSRVLFRRFEVHVKKRVKAEHKRNHVILKWFRRNIPAFACYMVLLNHVKKNPTSLSDADCLLTTSLNNFLLINSNNRNLWGAYLVYDTGEEKFIRSGKCTGRGMEERWVEHRKNAEANTNPNNSKFVGKYPSQKSTRASRSDGCYFENLHQYVAAGFEQTDTSLKLFREDYEAGGLFRWTSTEIDLVRHTNISGDGELCKFAAVAGYGFELCYDLAISLRDNVSESPGFESFGLMFGG